MRNDAWLDIKGSNPRIVGEAQEKAFRNAIEILAFEVGGGEFLQPIEIETATAAEFVEYTDKKTGKTVRKQKTASKKQKQTVGTKPTTSTYSCTLAITKYLDKSSPDLFVNFCKTLTRMPQKMSSAVLTVRKDDGPTKLNYLVFDFTDMYVISYELGLSEGADPTPVEKVSFRFGSCKMTYRKQTQQATADVIMGWDFEGNKPL